MADFMGGLGGLIKGLKPLMDATGAKEDESINVLLMQTDINELKEKKMELLAKIGQSVMNDSGLRGRYADICGEVEQIDKQILSKQTESENAQRALEEKKRAETLAISARTCPACGFENSEGTKFCSECGSKLGLPVVPQCEKCGAKNDAGAKFCGDCGARL